MPAERAGGAAIAAELITAVSTRLDALRCSLPSVLAPLLFYTQTSPMSYAAAIEQLNAMAPELFTKPGQPRRKFSLDQVRTLLAALGDPHTRFRSVLIAGTNGKGSTASTLASILTEAGLRTGLYTSPHLERVNERIRIGRDLITDDDFARRFFRVDDTAQKLVAEGGLPQLPSFFECLTALAFLHFAEAGVDIAVLEVGMGGRLDATNVVDPLLSVITDISLDHMEWLGSTIGEIAREKAGILRRGGTLITLPQHPEANQVLGEVAAELDVRAVSATPYMPPVGAAEPGVSRGGSGNDDRAGLAAAWHAPAPQHGAGHGGGRGAAAGARFSGHAGGHRAWRSPHRVARAPGAHFTRRGGVDSGCGAQSGRRVGIARRAARCARSPATRTDAGPVGRERPWVLVFSCLRDKPAAELAQILFPLFKQVIFAPIHSPRATPMEDLLAAAQATGTPAFAAGSVKEALELARRNAESSAAPAVVVVSGSVYLVGESRALLMSDIEHKESTPA